MLLMSLLTRLEVIPTVAFNFSALAVKRYMTIMIVIVIVWKNIVISIYLILLAMIDHGVYSVTNRHENQWQKNNVSLRGGCCKVKLACKADKLTDICVVIV